MPDVLAFVQARPEDGGGGAVVVLLKARHRRAAGVAPDDDKDFPGPGMGGRED